MFISINEFLTDNLFKIQIALMSKYLCINVCSLHLESKKNLIDFTFMNHNCLVFMRDVDSGGTTYLQNQRKKVENTDRYC